MTDNIDSAKSLSHLPEIPADIDTLKQQLSLLHKSVKSSRGIEDSQAESPTLLGKSTITIRAK